MSLHKVLGTNEFRGAGVSGLAPLMPLIRAVGAGNNQDNLGPPGSLLLYHVLYKIFSASFRMSASIKRCLALGARRVPALPAQRAPSPPAGRSTRGARSRAGDAALSRSGNNVREKVPSPHERDTVTDSQHALLLSLILT